MRPPAPLLFLGRLAVAALLATGAFIRAGDILRNGTAVPGRDPAGAAGGATASGSASAPQPRVSDTLARTAQAMAAVQAMQAAARSAAVAGPNNLGVDPNHAGRPLPNVADGLVVGGLQRATGDDATLWQGANLPVQTTADGKTQVTITQNAQQALLTWQSFSVGKNTTVAFDQSAGGENQGTWIAFNKINDPSGVPSQILGSIQAAGQVYLLNQNGIIFGGSSQVNTHGLVATSLPINDNLVNRGLLNNPDQQFIFSTLPLVGGANGTPAFTPLAALTPDGRSGDITVQAGAQLSSPTTAEHAGGRIALFGPNVTNAGTIATPDGQTILAAGQQIGLAPHDSNDPSLRGLDVFVGQGGGTVTNAASALVSAPRAAITFVGKTIDQLGALAGTTSVAFNGRVDLLASYDAVSGGGFDGVAAFLPQSTGGITLGPGSVTQILPEFDSTDRVVGSQLALRSVLNLQGQSSYLAPGATLVAPNAILAIDAGRWSYTGTGSLARSDFTYATGQIYLDTGATIDVAGSAGITAPVGENIVTVELRGAELANSLLQRDGALRGQTIQIDVRQTGTYDGQNWIGTPLADTTGYVALIEHTVGELTTSGGSAKLKAGSSVVIQKGATIDVSGGWIDYQGGTIETTKVLSGGRIYDISQATPDRVYDGLYQGGTTTTDAKWGVVTNTANPQLAANYEPGYRQGGGGGTLALTAPAMALDGTFAGATVAGPRQRSNAPGPSSLTLVFQSQDAALPASFYPVYSPTPPRIVFQASGNPTPVDAFSPAGTALSDERKGAVLLSPSLLGATGFGALALNNSDGSIAVPANVSLDAGVRGAMSFVAANVDVQGAISAPGGALTFTVYDRSPFADRALGGGELPATPQPDPVRGKFTLGAAAVLSTAGLSVDDRPGIAAAASLPLVTNGGAIAIASYSADLARGSVIDASGGVLIGAGNKATYGNGGSLAVRVGQDPKIGSLVGGKLNLSATLAAFSGAKGGALTLLAPSVQIGGTTSNSDTLLLAPDFFNRGGFSRFSVSGLGAATAQADRVVPGLFIAPGTLLEPVAQNRVLGSEATGEGGTFVTTVLPQGLRTPVSLSLSAVGVRDAFDASKPALVRGDLVLGAGAMVRTDPLGGVSLSGDTVLVEGSISSPGGAISIGGARDSAAIFSDPTQALPTVRLAAGSSLLAAGSLMLTPDPHGFRTGAVLSGGTIAVTGNIVAESGAKLDVSGASGVLDLPPSFQAVGGQPVGSTVGSVVVPTRVDSNGGTVALTGAQELFTDATLLGSRGGPSALGGSLSVSSGRFYPPGSSVVPTPLDVTLLVTQTSPAFTAGSSALGRPVLDAAGNALAGKGYFGADSFNSSGFDALALRGTVEFSGPVSATAARSLTVGTSGVLFANAAVVLRAPYVFLGASFQPPVLPQERSPFSLLPSFGPGNVSVAAGLVDVGNLSLQGVGKLSLTADNGDIRGDGALLVAGEIAIRAGQVYPPTGVTFTIAAYDHRDGSGTQAGSITIAGAGSRPLPYSAGGELTLLGARIDQGGVLRAPYGIINLGAGEATAGVPDPTTGVALAATRQLTLGTGSVTSVSAIDPITGKAVALPYGINLNGDAWIDPAGVDITTTGSPAKAINVVAADVAIQGGSTLDLRGGGDLSAYRWVSGVGGTRDILLTASSFAVMPGYLTGYAPYAPNNPSSSATNLGADPGYTNAGLTVGDRIYLTATGDLPAGTYTLLPARYALLPGAFLVTPKSGVPPAAAVSLADGASVVAGFRVNGLNAARVGSLPAAAFEVAPGAVTRARAQYDDSFANVFFTASAAARDAAVPRLPVDSGQLVLSATRAMNLQGAVAAQAPTSGRGALVDISSPAPIFIGSAVSTVPAGALLLSPSELNAIGAESLLIGGVRVLSEQGTTVAVKTESVTVANAGVPLVGADIILAANQSLTLAPGAAVEQRGTLVIAADPLLVGSSATPGSGDGVLLRVSSDPAATISRVSVDAAPAPSLTIGVNARVSGASVTVDSTQATALDPSAVLIGRNVALGSGRITLQLVGGGSPPADGGLVLAGAALQGLQSAQGISLLSYSSIDIYGSGAVGAVDASGQPALTSLALHAADVRGFNPAGGTVTFFARDILLDNSPAGVVPTAPGAPAGSLVFNGATIRLGANQLAVEQFANTTLNATGGIVVQGSGGFTAQGNVTLVTPLLTGATAAQHRIAAGGNLIIDSAAGAPAATVVPGLGASLSLQGGTIVDNSTIRLPSGDLTLNARRGDIDIVGQIDVRGIAKSFYELVKYTDGGQVRLAADTGSVNVAAGATIDVSGQVGGGSAGSVWVAAPLGSFAMAGAWLGNAGADGLGGSFSLDVGRLAGGSTAALDAVLNAGGFGQSRAVRVRSGDVTIDGTATAHSYNLSADQGSITVAARGLIDASGERGGAIGLEASSGVTLLSGATLTVAAKDFDAAGKGGVVSIETRGVDGGVIDLRAPQTASGNDLKIVPLNGTVVGASSIVAEGFKTFDLSAATGATITGTVQAEVLANGTAFAGNTSAITSRLLAGNGNLASALHVRPGAEIVNRQGDLTVNAAWDLSTFRFGAGGKEPGVLTLRAAGNLNFDYTFDAATRTASIGSLSDGFGGASTYGLWDMALLPVGSQSWSYRLVAGADFGAADFRRVRPLDSLGADAGSVLVGRGAPNLPVTTDSSVTRAGIIPLYYQVLRTGTGDIEIAAGRDVQLLNPIAAIYTAGSRVADDTSFTPPSLDAPGGSRASQLPFSVAQYSAGGGNVSIAAQRDIAHYFLGGSPMTLAADSSREMPTNWLYRRGAVDSSGRFATLTDTGEVASTSWWIDFANFFQGVGALGGGSVSLSAGRDVANVDAVVPTNARMPKGVPNTAGLVELGGGDLTVRAGRDIDGGVYYVERGQGALNAGGSIHTNVTRSALSQNAIRAAQIARTLPDSTTWLPTTLFLGKGTFAVAARTDLLLGPVANPFLLPQGANNRVYEKTYFSTYAPTSAVTVSSLTGTVTLRDNADPDGTGPGSLASWFSNVLASPTVQSVTPFAASQPWLRLVETDFRPFRTVMALMPPTLRATAFAGDIDIVGGLTLAPAVRGTIDLAAAGSIDGLQVKGLFNDPTKAYSAVDNPRAWTSARVNLSDADPARLPGVATPLSSSAVNTVPTLLNSINLLFAESGSTLGSSGVIQSKQALHAPGPLHAADAAPVRIYAGTGDITGLTVYSAKSARVVAGRDIADVGLYLQNVRESDVSLVTAGRDVVAFDPNSPARLDAQKFGNTLGFGGTAVNPNSGDIQVSGPGALEVLAGRSLVLGAGRNRSDPADLDVGITSIGNTRNPSLPFNGAEVIVGAGTGAVGELGDGRFDFAAFIAKFLNPVSGGALAERYLAELGALIDLRGGSPSRVWEAFVRLPAERQRRLALDVFYLVLRDAGRDHNDPEGPGYKNYDGGFAAIAALIRPGLVAGNVALSSREIRTKNGGSISVFVPGGGLTLGFDVGGSGAPAGILTEHGGNISIFADKGVFVGALRIFTLRGGNEVIWSSTGDIAAGVAAKTVQSAPPTRVQVDPQSADVKTDLAGLATGGGIGVLAAVVGVPAGDVDLIAPVGTIDAGDAGIRVSGNLNISALQVVNASNIQTSGASVGTPAVVAPNFAGLATVASSSAASTSGAANEVAKQSRSAASVESYPSVITVEVLGYGGDDAGEAERKSGDGK